MTPARGNNIILEGVRRFGSVVIFLVQLCAQCIPSLARPRLLVHQIYNTGARSLIIIMLSGLFVGMVLGLQGYDLRRWASSRNWRRWSRRFCSRAVPAPR